MSWPAPRDYALPSASLAFFLDKKVLVLVLDGRIFLGILRSFDQFANIVLEGASERVIVGDLCSDISIGLYVVRGDNVVLIGELDPAREELPVHMTRVSVPEIRRVGKVTLRSLCPAQKAEKDAVELKSSMRKMMEFLDVD
ncbi:hypothetical protein Taro_012414 [Colocasia esculenta]|uniref:U6 snRNA-associated Sm-like protein LSm1 n=1 Tax=Colocasia esculenta TaxID=4460 RepID=A0A843UCT2_COLES|nr:hypothetical protein [Colocasia esculenta]